MSSIFKNPDSKKNSEANGIQEDESLFVTWSNPKTGNEFKLLNLEHDSYAPREGIIELKPTRVTKRHDNNVGFRLLQDKVTGCFVGIPVQFDPKSGEPRWKKITISNFETYNLAIPDQRKEWICIKHSPYFSDIQNGVETNKNFDPGVKNIYKAVDKEREARDFAKGRMIKKKAESIAESLEGSELTDIALMCSFDPKSMTLVRLHMEVIKYAEAKPDDFMKIINSDVRRETAVFKRALLSGIIHDALAEGFNWNGLSLGHSEYEAVQYLKEHPTTTASLDALSRKREGETDKTMKDSIDKFIDKSAREIELERQLEEAQKRLNKITEEKLEEKSASVLAEEDPRLASLLAEAKQLDVRGAHKVKDPDKLQSLIDAKKKLKDN